VIAVLVVVLALWVVPIFGILDAARRPDAAWIAVSSSRAMWIVLQVLFGVIASIIYFVVIRPRLIVAGQATGGGWGP
jgi:hypothetical protein